MKKKKIVIMRQTRFEKKRDIILVNIIASTLLFDFLKKLIFFIFLDHFNILILKIFLFLKKIFNIFLNKI